MSENSDCKQHSEDSTGGFLKCSKMLEEVE